MSRDSITWLAESNPHWNRNDRKAYLVHIYPPSATMGQRSQLGDDPVLVGRDDDCNIRIDDHSVSRWHARILLTTEGFRVLDLDSTNGTYVNQLRIGNALLRDGDYLQIGNCIFRFLSGGNVEASYHEEIYRATIIDALTGVYNRRYLMDFLERELVRSSRHHRPLSLVLMDIDHFKQINDQWGHLCGDYTLRELTKAMKEEIRRDELLGRYGGDEFTVILPEADSAASLQMAERIRSIVEQHPFRYDDQEFSVTISLGTACTDGSAAPTCEQILHEADHNLYTAKDNGRNRICAETLSLV